MYAHIFFPSMSQILMNAILTMGAVQKSVSTHVELIPADAMLDMLLTLT